MNKNQWQETHGFSDQDMSEIIALKECCDGTIVKVSQVPRTPNGQAIPFFERQTKDVHQVWTLWSRLSFK
jgi:hypothetical protein